MTRLSFTIPIEPGLLAVNRKHAPRQYAGHMAIGNAARFTAAFDEAVLHARAAVVRERWKCRAGEVAVSMTVYLGSRSMDVDACVKATLDCLQGSAFENDSQVSDLRVRRVMKSDNPRIEVEVRDP